MKRRPLAMACLMIVLLFYLGTLLTGTPPSGYEKLEGETVTITGVVKQKEQTNRDGVSRNILYLQMKVLQKENIRIQPAESRETVICNMTSNQISPEIGSVVKVKGNIKCFTRASNPGQFDAQSYYRILKISFQLNQTEIQQKSTTYDQVAEGLYRFRKKCAGRLDAALPPKEASLMKTMLLGEKRAVDEGIKELYQQNGIAHILAISGLHISLLGMSLYKLLKRIGVPIGIRVMVPMVLIVLYVFMTGFSVSAIRAMVMFLLQMTAQLLKRTYDLLTSAFLAAVLIVAEQPLYLYYSGFLFSFGCIYAIGLVVPAMTTAGKKPMKNDRKERQPEGMVLRFLSGLSLTLACLPLQLCFFYQIPLYATLLNLLVIPLMSFLVPAGTLLMMMGEASGIIAEIFIKVASALCVGILAVYEESCEVLVHLPGHLFTRGRPEGWQILLYLFLLATVVLLGERLTLKKKWLLLLCGVVLLCVSFPKDMAITFLDVGQGDCIYIRSRGGNHYLVDGGSSSVSKVGEYRIIPFLKYQGVAELEAVFITHPDDDHCNGILELLEQGKNQGIIVKQVYLPDVGEIAKTEKYRELETVAKGSGACVNYLSVGEVLQENDLTFSCLHPSKDYISSESNEMSLVLYLSYGEFGTLLTGDVSGNGEYEMMGHLADGRIRDRLTVLKVAHHGSAYSTPEELLAMLRPVYSVISCAENNSYGHPHEELLLRLRQQDAKIFITYKSGAITFSTDGKKLRIKEFLRENN